jgi:hypothetical protein
MPQSAKITGMTTPNRQDAERAAELARDLENVLTALAFPMSADGVVMIDLEAWKDAGVAEMLTRLQHRISQVLPHLSR